MPETTAATYASPLSPAPAWQRDSDDALRRFAVLIGLRCPRCGHEMVLAGPVARPRLMCVQSFGYGSLCSLSYSNVETAEDELRPH